MLRLAGFDYLERHVEVAAFLQHRHRDVPRVGGLPPRLPPLRHELMDPRAGAAAGDCARARACQIALVRLAVDINVVLCSS